MLIRPTGHTWHIPNRIHFRAKIAVFIFFGEFIESLLRFKNSMSKQIKNEIFI